MHCLCSNHFANDAYVPSHSPEFLRSLNFPSKRKALLKADAVPTLNKPLDAKRAELVPEKRKDRLVYSQEKKVKRLYYYSNYSDSHSLLRVKTLIKIFLFVLSPLFIPLMKKSFNFLLLKEIDCLISQNTHLKEAASKPDVPLFSSNEPDVTLALANDINAHSMEEFKSVKSHTSNRWV